MPDITIIDHGKIFDNRAAGGTTTFNLPKAADVFGKFSRDPNRPRFRVTFNVVANQALSVTPDVADTIRIQEFVTSLAVVCNQSGGVITLECTSASEWTAVEFVGNWGHRPAGYTVYTGGSTASVTDTYALLTFGIQSPTLTLALKGTYLLLANVSARYNEATFGAEQTASFKLRKTSATAADLANSERVMPLEVVTETTRPIGTIQLPPVIYAAQSDAEVVQLWGRLSATPSEGSIEILAAEIVAVRIGA